jgi:sugar lactone lactonase YvrE
MPASPIGCADSVASIRRPEGPVWFADQDGLAFSDLPDSRINGAPISAQFSVAPKRPDCGPS